MPYIIPARTIKRSDYSFVIPTKRNISTSTDSSSKQIFPWVSKDLLDKSYVISIRPFRYQNFLTRMGHWSTRVEKVNGVNGHHLNMQHLKREGELRHIGMKRGRVGCFMSHRKIWDKIIKDKTQISFIMEDDVNLVHSAANSDRLREVFGKLYEKRADWDIAYLCHHHRGTQFQSDVGPDFAKVSTWHVLYGYAITLKGAEILSKHSRFINDAVDVHIGNLTKRSLIKAIKLKSPICAAKFSGSDTESIL